MKVNHKRIIAVVILLLMLITNVTPYALTKKATHKKPAKKSTVKVKKPIIKKSIVRVVTKAKPTIKPTVKVIVKSKPTIKPKVKPVIKATIAPTPEPVVLSIKFEKVVEEIAVGNTIKLNPIVETSAKMNYTIEYSTDKNDLINIDKDGSLTAVAPGEVTVTAKVNDKSASIMIKVNPKLIDLKATLSTEKTSGKFLMVCEKAKIKVNLITKPENQKLEAVSQFNSSNPSIATVDNDGNITGVSTGNNIITVSIKDKKAEIPIVVYDENTDTDKDGLTDYKEIHKYFTNPEKADTDGDGIPDGDWNERREYTYTIDLIDNVIKPYKIDTMDTIFQDAKVIHDYQNYATIEFILYPYSTAYDNLGENPNWQRDNANNPQLQQYLKPGTTTNWDEQMKQGLIKELNQAGIYPDKLTDLELVKKVSKWMMDTTKSINSGGLDALLSYVNGKATIPDKYKAMYNGTIWTENDIFDKLVYGKQMFYNKTRGACLSSSTYWATVWRALGIPTKINFNYACFHYTDDTERKLVKNIKNEGISNFWSSFFTQQSGIYDHFYTQVYIGGRWVDIDYDDVGANELTKWPTIFIESFNDNSENNRAEYLYKMYEHDQMIPNDMPYQLVSTSDDYGKHYSDSPYFEILNKKDALNKSKMQFNNSHIMYSNDNVRDAIKTKISRIQTCGGTYLTSDEISVKNMLVLLDDNTIPISMQIQDVFKCMKTNDKNYLNVKIVNGKLLVYLKTENEEKMIEYINQLDESDFYTEQYINFDEQ